jgi:hypothetical protein
MDFFTVPMITFRLMYCFFVMEHDRRKILHFNVTAPNRRLDLPAIARGIPEFRSIQIRRPRPRLEI